MGTWSEDKLKSLRSQYNFEKRTWPNAKPEVPQECELDSRGILQWKGGKRPVVHSGYWVDPKSRAKDSTFKPGDHVVIQAGYGGKGGLAGQDFKRFSSDTPAVVTDIAGGDIYVRPEGDNYKWKVQAKALVEGTAKASARDADRRSRLHRALDAVIDSCGAKARDAKPVSIISKAISVLNASYGFDTVGRKGDNVLVRKGYFYSNGGSEDKVADRAISTLAAAGIKARVMRTGDVWKPFKGGASIAAQSHWWVELRISEATK